MRKLLFLILFLISTVCYAGFQVDGVTDPAEVDGVAKPAMVDGVTSSYASCPDCILWITFDNADCSTPLTSYTIDDGNTEKADGDTTLEFYSSAVIDQDAAMNGNCGLDIPGASDFIRLNLNTGGIAAQGRCGFKFYLTTSVDNATLFYTYEGSGNYNKLFMDTSPTSEFRTYYDEDSGYAYIVSSGGDLPTTTEIFVEYAWDANNGAGSDYMEIFKDGVSVASSSTRSILPLDAGYIDIGSTGSHAVDYYIDTFVCTTDETFDLYDLVVTQGITEFPGN